MRIESRQYLWVLLGLCSVNLMLVWLLPILPMQDVPQHLAYARIFIDYHNHDLEFYHHYLLPDSFQPYFTPYYILAFVGKWTSTMTAFRLLMSIYVLAVPLAFHLLVKTLYPGEQTRFTGLFGVFLVWNPVAIMGFLAFMLCLPLIVLGCAFLVRLSHESHRRRNAAILSVISAVLASLHIAALACFVLIVVLYAIFLPNRQVRLTCLGCIGVAVGTLIVWSAMGELGTGDASSLKWIEPIRAANGLEFVNETFGFSWSDPVEKTNYILWTTLGPYRWHGLLLMLTGIGIAAIVIRRSRICCSSDAVRSPERIALTRTAIGFVGLCWLAPWGMKHPSELTFLDFRMMTVALPLVLVLIPVDWFQARRARHAAIGVCALCVVQFSVCSLGFAGESRQGLTLISQARPLGTLNSLVFHNKSAYFAKQFGVTHFLPMYYTVFHGGIASQFWGRYTHHLPIGYRPSRKPYGTADWLPHEFKPTNLRGADFLLIQPAKRDDSTSVKDASRRTFERLPDHVQEIECSASWCLYRVVRTKHRKSTKRLE